MSEPTSDARRALRDAWALGRELGLPYGGDVHPIDAWALAEAGAATIVDVRSPEEWHFVGHVPGSVLVPWASGAELLPVLVVDVRTDAQPVAAQADMDALRPKGFLGVRSPPTRIGQADEMSSR